MLLHPPHRLSAIVLSVLLAGVLVPSSAASRAFMAPLGQQFDTPTTGNTTVIIAPGTTLHLDVWIDGPYPRTEPELVTYQLMFHDQAEGGDSGSITYVDNNPGQGGGDSVFLDTTRDDWVFANTFAALFPPVYNEPSEVGLFGVIFHNAVFDTKVTPDRLSYLCEFDIFVSGDARGLFAFGWSMQSGKGPPPYAEFFREGGHQYDPLLEFQNLTIIVTDCGDGVLEPPPEQCDDGNTSDGDGCDATCQIEECGNGLVQFGETCDDANTADDDGCSATCSIEPGFACDGAPSECSAICGDGLTVGQEECDDGNLEPGDGCDENCIVEECGNAVVQFAEECDDGNVQVGDGCDEHCIVEQCGNSVVQVNEDCDDGGETAGCDADCTLATCGDGTLNPLAGEECDDGNTDEGDGCDDQCTFEVCGNSIVQFGETCDDGNQRSADGCDSDCLIEVCGNGVVQVGEECDDGNLINGDGCSFLCELEAASLPALTRGGVLLLLGCLVMGVVMQARKMA